MIFLKLGGSLITEKARPETPRLEVLARLAGEIAQARAQRPETRLLLGHGSGSFGHPAAALHRTHEGASSPAQWLGFQQTWAAAHRLHQHVLEALEQAQVPAISLPPSASTICEQGVIVGMATEPVAAAVAAGLVPVVLGDVAFDRLRGATIVSTEQVMAYLATVLQPDRVLLAGIEAGVYADYPPQGAPRQALSPEDLPEVQLGGSGQVDVTGGMLDKVRWAFELARGQPVREVRIFSGSEPGNVLRALSGEALGTLVTAWPARGAGVQSSSNDSF